MEIFDIIQTLVDLSNKGSEYNEEIGELNLKVSTLQATLLKLEKGRALDSIQIKYLKDLLNDGITLMQNVSKQTNLWRNIRNMFPGSELSQIKEINAKIEKVIQLVNLSINTHAAYKKRNYREIDSDSDSNCSSQNNQKQNKRKPKQLEGAMQAALIAETLNFDMIKPTIAMEDSKHEEQFPTGEAFSVKIQVDDKELKKLAKQHKLAEIFVNWTGQSDECTLELGRATFSKLGEAIYNKISRKHCVIYARREKQLIQAPAAVQQSKEMIAETLCMNDLYLALPKTQGKSKKNPSIHINGEKVFDSDVEEKKEKSQFLTVSSSKLNAFLSAKSSKQRAPASIIKEEDKEFSSQSDDIFYTCPQIDESSRKNGMVYTYSITYEIEDFSTNGTFLNGERLEKNKRVVIKDSDQIGIIGQDEPAEGGVKIILGYMFRDVN